MTSQALNRPVDVIGVLDAAGANPYAEEGSPAWSLAKLGEAVVGLVAASTQAKRAYWLAHNSAAGLTNFCEESASTRRCERDLEEADAIWRAAGLDAALAALAAIGSQP